MALIFANGLTSTDKSFYPVSITSVVEYIQNNNDLYEVTFRDGTAHGRAHIDIDGKLGDVSEEEFSTTHQMLLTALSSLEVGTPFSLCTSSKYQNKNHSSGATENKLSYSMIFTNKCGSNRAVANWTRTHVAPLIKEAVEMILPFYIPSAGEEKPKMDYIDYDPSVYSKNRKMRAVGSTKPNENRPKVIHTEHGVMDTLISYIPDGCEALPEPEVKVMVNEVVMPTVTVSGDDTLRHVVMALKASRADDRKDWLSVGIALYNEDQSCDIWEEFSKQSPKYRWGECERLWRGFRKGNLTQRSLWKMLQEDNPEVFKAMNAKRGELEEAFAVVAHVPYAKHFVLCRPDDYLYDVGTGWWYIQTNKTWANAGSKFPPGLTIAISRTLYAELEDYRQSLRYIVLQKGEDLDATSYEGMAMKRALEGTKSVLQAGFLKSVAEMCQGLYAERTTHRLNETGKSNVKEMMDSNPMLFAFKDGVYDFSLSEGKAVGKRSIVETDYITTTCGYNYPERNPAVRQKMEEVLKGIWSKKGAYGDNGETYEYVMKIMASTLCGTRWMEAFYILTGSGRNGKGLLFELLQAVMGDYFYQLPVQVLTTKIDNPRAPNPDIANLVGKRMVCSSEPEANEKLHEGTVKYMTGGDKLTGRALYGSPIQFKPQFGLFLQCNNIPNFNGITRGGVMRNKVIPFPFEFKSEPKTDREKKGDALIKDVLCKSGEWRDEMFHLLLDHFESVRGKSADDVPMPQLVEERTNEYVSENNLIGVWWKENYTQAEGEYVLSKEAYNTFKAETGSQITDKQFKSGLEFNLLEVKKIGKRGPMKDKMGVAGWKRREHENVPEDDDEKE